MKGCCDHIARLRNDLLGYFIYPASVNLLTNGLLFMANNGTEDLLIETGGTFHLIGEHHQSDSLSYQIAPLTHQNAHLLHALLPFTAPLSLLSQPLTGCLGDPTGESVGLFLKTACAYGVLPVWAREAPHAPGNNLRSHCEKLVDDATFTVFREGYAGGYGICSPPLSSVDEAFSAVQAGCTILCLDGKEFRAQPELAVSDPLLEYRYLSGMVGVPVRNFALSSRLLRSLAPSCKHLLTMAQNIYREVILPSPSRLDLMISLRGKQPTTPQQYFLLADLLHLRGVDCPVILPEYPSALSDRFTLTRHLHKIAEENGYKPCLPLSCFSARELTPLQDKTAHLILMGP